MSKNVQKCNGCDKILYNNWGNVLKCHNCNSDYKLVIKEYLISQENKAFNIIIMYNNVLF